MVGVKVGVEEDYSKLGHYWRDPRSDRPAFSNHIMHICLLYFAIFNFEVPFLSRKALS